MSILVSGSLALDHLMVFPDRFKDHILPEKIATTSRRTPRISIATVFGARRFT